LAVVQYSFGAIVKAEQYIGIVIQPPTFHKDSQVRDQFRNFKPSDVFGQIVCMGAQVAYATGCSTSCRIGTPLRLFLSRSFQQSGEPALRIFHNHFADLAQSARFYQVTGFLHHGISSVVMGEREE